MENSFCGKDCNDCLDKEEVGCPGCKAGPGKSGDSLCEIANCCHEQCKEDCKECGMNASCDVLADRNTMLQKWHGNRNNETTVTDKAVGSRVRDSHNAPLLRKTLLAIFWLFFVGGTGNVLSNENLFGSASGVIALGSVISLGANIAQGILMIRLGTEERAYKVAGICNLVGTGLSFVAGFFTSVFAVVMVLSDVSAGVIGLVFGVLLLLAALVLEIISGYQFLVANARVVELRDAALSNNWSVMSKLYFAVFGGLVLVPILFFVLEAIGIIIGFLYLLGVLAYGICEYVFLYQTAERFRE